MRALRVVGLTEDGEVVLEDPVRLERFRVPADERLRAAARGDLSRLGQIAIELESQLRPREIQARIRAGASVEQVAAAAGVPEQKIERFAYPVLLERFRTAENAQRAHPVRADGPDNRTLTEVVEHTFGLRGQAYEGARWDSWKGEDGRWIVALGWRAGRSENRAHWTFQPGAHGGTVTALDEHASDLVEGLPARPLRTVGAVVDMTRPEEELPPTPSPVEQWRAAASDSYRERMPHAPEPRPSSGRTAPEPWRPAPPAQRQAERENSQRENSQRENSQRENSQRENSQRENGQRAAVEWTPVTGSEQRGATEAPTRPEPTRAAPTNSTSTTAAPPAPAPAIPIPPIPTPAATATPTPTADAPSSSADVPTSTPLSPTSEPAPAATPAAAATPAVTETAPSPEPLRATPLPKDAAPAQHSAPSQDAALPEPDPAATGIPAPVTDQAADVAIDPEPSTPAQESAPAAPEPVTPVVPKQATEEPAVDTPAANRRTRKGKPVMPSWDEVLLGVRGPR